MKPAVFNFSEYLDSKSVVLSRLKGQVFIECQMQINTEKTKSH